MYQINITVIVAEFWYYKLIKGSALFICLYFPKPYLHIYGIFIFIFKIIISSGGESRVRE